jgi:hypothetical protein
MRPLQGLYAEPKWKSPLKKIYGFENALVGQTRVMTRCKTMPLTHGEPRELEVDRAQPLMGAKHPLSSGCGRNEARGADTRRPHV